MANSKGAKLALAILPRLQEKYPNARYELDWDTPLQLLVATILAAQCTDARVNQVTKTLFPKYKDARAYAEAKTEELEEDIRPTGTYKNKAKSIQGACRVLVANFHGEVPKTMEELKTLPGVQRKSANVVLNTAFNIASGIIVDTHVARVSPRLGLTTEEKPEAIERDLMEIVPQDRWTFFGPAMVLHGRYTCTAKAPQCEACVLNDLCEKNGVALPPPKETGSIMTYQRPKLPPSWEPVLAEEFEKPYFEKLMNFVADERAKHQVFPPEEDVFNALNFTPFDKVNALLLGQDPYHDDNQAHGLCFSVRPGIKTPPSLVNMYKELKDDLGCKIPNNGYLEPWAKQGLLMLNAVLTVRAHTPNSHKDQGWETFTDAIIKKVSAKTDPVVFILWGGYAKKKAKLIDKKRHTVLEGAHPSPLSAHQGFFGSKPFSNINAALKKNGKPEIDWQLPNL